MNTITAKELKAKMDGDANFLLIDLRDLEHYEHNHIVGALNVPYDDKFVETAGEVLPDKEVEVILYADFPDKPVCPTAVSKLTELGYQNVKCFDGGLHGWMEAGHQLQFGEES